MSFVFLGAHRPERTISGFSRAYNLEMTVIEVPDMNKDVEVVYTTDMELVSSQVQALHREQPDALMIFSTMSPTEHDIELQTYVDETSPAYLELFEKLEIKAVAIDFSVPPVSLECIGMVVSQGCYTFHHWDTALSQIVQVTQNFSGPDSEREKSWLVKSEKVV